MPSHTQSDSSPYPVAAYNWNYTFEKLYAHLMEDVWKCGYEEQVMYDMVPAYFDWCFDEKGDILCQASDHDRVVGFAGASRRPILLDGQAHTAYLGHLFSVDRKYQRQGIGYRLFKHRLEKVLEQDSDNLLLIYQDEGHGSNRLLRKFLAKEPYAAVRLCRFNFYTKIFDMRGVHGAEPMRGLDRLGLLPGVRHYLEAVPRAPKIKGAVREYQSGDEIACLAMVNQYAHRPHIRLARLWQPGDLDKQLNFPGLSQTYVYEKHKRVIGMLNSYVMTLRGRTNIRAAVIDNLHIDALSVPEQKAFLAHSLHNLRRQGCTAVISCNFKYFPRFAFEWARFIEYPRYIHFIALGKKRVIEKIRPMQPEEIYFDHK